MQRLRLDASLDFESDTTSAERVMARIEDYIKAQCSSSGAPTPMDIGSADMDMWQGSCDGFTCGGCEDIDAVVRV